MHVLQLVGSLLQAIATSDATVQQQGAGEGQSAAGRPPAAALAALAERLFTRFLFTIPQVSQRARRRSAVLLLSSGAFNI